MHRARRRAIDAEFFLGEDLLLKKGANTDMEATDSPGPGEYFPLTRQSEGSMDDGIQPLMIANLGSSRLTSRSGP
jgi:hypothetical protein